MGSLSEHVTSLTMERPDKPVPKKKPRLNEALVQRLIYHRNNFKPVFCNVFVGKYNTNEFDALTITDAGYATGYEIKLSRSDLKADLNKPRHELLLNRQLQGSQPRGEYFRRVYRLGLPLKYFWYVCGEFKVTAEDVPEYAGLMIADEYGLKVVKPAPRLWNEKVKETVLPALYENIAKRLMTNRMMTVYDDAVRYRDEIRAWNNKINLESSHKA